MISTFVSKTRDRSKSRVRKGRVAAAAIVAAAGMALTAAPTASATTSVSYDFTLYGTDGYSYFDGIATFTNRSASVEGYFHAVGCRRFYASTYAGSTRLDYKSTSTHCNTTTYETISLNANVVGGANRIHVELTDQYGTNKSQGDIYR